MGFWDREVDNSFDAMFDFNRDGRLDPVEEGIQFDYMERESRSYSSSSYDEEDEMEDELESAGLDPIDLSMMDADERREAIEDAGLDPDDFDDCDF